MGGARISRRVAGLATACALLAGACGDDGGSGDLATTSAPAEASTSTTAPAVEAAVFEWDAIDDVDLGDGWHLVDCPGDAPVWCLERDGTAVGIVESSRFPLDTLPAVSAALPDGDEAALEAQAEEYFDSLRAIRLEDCGDDYEFTALPRRAFDGPGGAVLRYGFQGGSPGGPRTERTTQWAGIRGDELVLVQLSAYDDGACVSPEGEATTDRAAAVEPLLEAAIEVNDLPV